MKYAIVIAAALLLAGMFAPLPAPSSPLPPSSPSVEYATLDEFLALEKRVETLEARTAGAVTETPSTASSGVSYGSTGGAPVSYGSTGQATYDAAKATNRVSSRTVTRTRTRNLGRILDVRRLGGRWNIEGTWFPTRGFVESHLSVTHGYTTSQVQSASDAQLVAWHDARHRATVSRSVTRQVSSNCPGGVCPVRPTRRLFRRF